MPHPITPGASPASACNCRPQWGSCLRHRCERTWFLLLALREVYKVVGVFSGSPQQPAGVILHRHIQYKLVNSKDEPMPGVFQQDQLQPYTPVVRAQSALSLTALSSPCFAPNKASHSRCTRSSGSVTGGTPKSPEARCCWTCHT